MPIIEITRTDDPAVIPYTLLTEHQLRQRTDGPQGLFIAESPKVIRTALQAGYLPVSLLCERKHLQGDASFFVEEWGHRIPIYTGERSLLSGITGYTLTRGVLCAMQRQPEPLLRDICQHAKRIVVIDVSEDKSGLKVLQYRCHLPFCHRLGHGCRSPYPYLMRPFEQAFHPCIHGHSIPNPLDMD